MKKLNCYIITGISFLFYISAVAQLQVDHPIQLTGSGANAKISGIQNVSNTQDAASAGVVQSGSLVYNVATGSNNAFILNIYPQIAAYQPGMVFNFISNQSVTGPATLTVDGLAAVPVKKYVNQDFAGCEIQNGQVVTVVYDGTNFQITSVFENALPTTSVAGSNQLNINGTTTTLAANTPANGTGAWSIVSGSGGSFANSSNPTTAFTGVRGGSYTLQWTISTTNCGSSSSQVDISFSNIPAGCDMATDGTVWCVAQDNNTTGATLCGYEAGYSGTYYAITTAGATALGMTVGGYGDCATNYTEGATTVIQGYSGSNCWTTEEEWARNGTNTGADDYPVVRCTSYE